MENSLKLIQAIQAISIMGNQKKSSIHIAKTINKQARQLIKDFGKPQIIQDCLLTLDIFKNIIQTDDETKRKIIRDVTKNIEISSHDQGQLIYEYQTQADSIYLVFHGQVSLNYRKVIFKENVVNEKGVIEQKETEKQIFQQVDSFTKGSGFGQAQFISGKKRGFRAIIKQSNAIIGKLDVTSFEEIIQNYKLRIYYKKLEMFKKCPLLSKLPVNRLQFIVNNSKPIFLGISNNLIKSGEKPKYLYLLSKGLLQIKKKDEVLPFKSDSLNLKKSKYFKLSPSKRAREDFHIGVIQEGSFIGDCEIALDEVFKYQINIISEKVSLYACDVRLIVSQIPSQQLEMTKMIYIQKKNYHQERLQQFQKVRSQLNQQSINSGAIVLTPQQIRIKRKIQKRYNQNSPTLIGQSSPLQISYMLQKKFSRLKTLNFEQNNSLKLPKIQIFGRISRQQVNKPKYMEKIRRKLKSQKNNHQISNIYQVKQNKNRLQKSYSQRSNAHKISLKIVERKISDQLFVTNQSPLKFKYSNNQSPLRHVYLTEQNICFKSPHKKKAKETSTKVIKNFNKLQFNVQKKRFDQFLIKLKQLKK